MATATRGAVPGAAGARRQNFWEALDQRLGLTMLDYPVPAYANTLLYSLGGLTLLGFLALVITGILMTQFYSPDPQTANDSVRFLLGSPSLNFLRNLHFWAAQVVMLTLGLHIVRVIFTGSYKRPRELNWYVGVALFVVMVALAFTGTVLKWDQEGYEALEHARAVAKLAGVEHLLMADFAPETSLLARFFGLHTSALPLLAAALIGLHLLLIKLHGISPMPFAWVSSRWAQPSTFRRHLRHLLGYGAIVYGLATLAALVVSAPLGELPIEGLEITKPPWFFWPLYAVEYKAGIPGLFWGSLAVVLGLVLLPVLDRTEERSPARRWWVVALLAAAAVAAVAALVFVGVTPPAAHIG